METFGASISEVRNVATGNSNDGTVEMEGFKQRVDEIISKVQPQPSFTPYTSSIP
ncbi:hypothetical protein LR48_Vigan10g121100 [Vigna angularis]|uniref:Uncharacterized protein n=1 Tax=Phaseolus angularis TaxID=3914 RepID=A0A0L9VKQ9_PHAAN|nr:hypothetical protein LR48_Vigan10g121100 [Vigna angularis]